LVALLLVLREIVGLKNNKVWTSGIVLSGSILEVFECKDITQCVDNLIQNIRFIEMHNSSPISLVPSIFREMFKLPELNLIYKGEEVRNFLKRKNIGLDLIEEYQYISRIQVISLKDPYNEILWLFTRISRKDYTEAIPRLKLYILHFVGNENAIFD
jgi:hypothetical protein